MSSLQDSVESLIDANGLLPMVEALAEVCAAKAQHLRSAWKDDTTAQRWELIAGQIDATRGRIERIGDPLATGKDGGAC